MKKLTVVISVLALAFGMANAASVKTSKAQALNSAQMQSVRGEGYFYVWVWVTPGQYNPNGNTLYVGTGDPNNPGNVNNVTGSYPAGGTTGSGAGYYAVGAGSGPCSFDGYIYIGGPLAGQSKTH